MVKPVFEYLSTPNNGIEQETPHVKHLAVLLDELLK